MDIAFVRFNKRCPSGFNKVKSLGTWSGTLEGCYNNSNLEQRKCDNLVN